MHRETLSIDALPAWAQVNQVQFHDIAVQAMPSNKGYGLVATAQVVGKNAPLLTVPRELILSLENVWIMAKADKSLREVLENMGDYARVKSPNSIAVLKLLCVLC